MTQGTTERPMLAAALGYAERGWDVFPAPPGEKKSCKSAAYSNGAKWGKTRDPEQIRKDFNHWPKANVGIPTGAESGFWVVEADTPKGHDVDGIASLRVLEEKHGPLPPTLMAESPSGSLHHYFKWPDAAVIKNSASGIGPGIDVRGEGGMVIAPPSVRGDGAYRWLNDNPIADAPQWLIDKAVTASKNGKGTDDPAEEPQAPIERIRAAFAVIPNEKRGWDDWNRCGLALFHATGGSDDGLEIFHAWSGKSKKYNAQATDERWAHHKTYPPTEIGAGSIFHWANEASPGWEMLIGMSLEQAMKIGALVSLSTFEYEIKRKAVAEEMGMRASVLDDMVDRLRTRRDDDDDGKQGHAISFPEPEQWPEPVDGAELLDETAKAMGAHVIMAEHSRDACALWAAHTFLTDCTMISPRLAFTSPTKGCGKTTALDVMGQLVLRPLAAANVSPSAIFRVVEACHPTLLIDEADSFLKDNEELRGVLNSGHRRGGSVLRTVAVGDDFEVRSFSTYGACVIALIGQLPGTLADRSVSIVLTRRKHSEPVTPFRLDRVGHLVTLARKLARWTKDNEGAIAAVEPEMPAGLYNRAADNWRTLLAIATVAGGDWLARGHKAALASAGADVDEMSRLELLLGDTRDVFDGLTSDTDRISSAHLIEKLVVIVPRPWAEYGKAGKPITQNKLARLLQPLHISAQVIRIGDETPRGYYRKQFEEAWERFLSPEGGFKAQQRNKADEMGTSDLFQSATAEPDVAVRKREKSNNDGLCCGVADEKGGTGEKARVWSVRPRSDDLPYTGPVVEVPDHGPDPLDEHGEPVAATPNGGDREAGLSQRAIRELADRYLKNAEAMRNGGCRVEKAIQNTLDAGLRQVLAEMVLPEFVEVEFERVMAEVFRV